MSRPCSAATVGIDSRGMGLEYQRWLIAKGNTFAPGAASVVKLVERLQKDGWVPPTDGRAVRTIENTFGRDAAAKEKASTEPLPGELTADWIDAPEREEMRIVWRIDGSADLRYPLSRRPSGETSWTLELHRAPEYVVPTRDAFDELDTECRCGEDLAFEWDESDVVPAFRGCSGIFAECEECSRTFDPSKSTATIQNPFDRTEVEVAGGAAYRFALVVDCGSSFVADAALAFAPELVTAVEEVFGRGFYEVGATR